VKIAHLTSAHPRADTRVFVKMCCRLARNGYNVTLVVADGLGPEFKNGVAVVDVGEPRSRLARMTETTISILDVALSLDADLYHLHDPELIPIGLRLRRHRKKVVFDSHEDVPKQLLGKPYLGPVSSRVASACISVFERFACAKFDGIVAATPTIRDKFLEVNARTVDVNNFPLSTDIYQLGTGDIKPNEVCYIGSISKIRGIREIVRALEYVQVPVRLNLGGRFADAVLEDEVKAYPQWERVNQLGFLDREGVRSTLARSVAGLVTLHPASNYIDSLPVKMFEYMAAGIPVIASNFPLWRDIVETSDCGVCVDPMAPREIARAIDLLTGDHLLARRLGENGRRAAANRYNWEREEEKLLAFYKMVLGQV